MNQNSIQEIEKGILSESSTLSEILHTFVSSNNNLELKNLEALRPIELFNFSEKDFKNFGFTTANSKRLYSMTLLFKKFKKFESEIYQIRSLTDAYNCFSFMRTLPQEEVWTIYLDAKNQVIRKEIVAQGSIDSSVFPSKVILKNAISYGASSIIVAHNHPTGNPAPSDEDIETTKKFFKMCEITEIILVDHIIVGSNSYSSLKQKGYF
jgi:DNA repair protein RadC